MKRILNIELYKLVYYKPTFVLSLIYFLLLIILGVSAPYFSITVETEEITLQKLGAFNFGVIWQIGVFFALLLKMFLGIIIINSITLEYSNKTLKQNIIDGMSKWEFFMGKILVTTVFSAISTIVLGIVIFVLGSIYSESESSFVEGMGFLGYYFLNLLCFFSLLILLSFLFKKSAITILMIVILYIGEGVFFIIERVIREFAFGQNLQEIADTSYIINYLPFSSMSGLVPWPHSHLMNYLQGLPVFELDPPQPMYIVMNVVYVLLFSFLSYRLLKKRDL